MSAPYVLIVDDDDALRETTAELLELAGHPAVAVPDGRAALEHLRTHPPPRLILLDLMMPGMDGVEFRRHQREDPTLRALPVVVMTASRNFDPESLGEVRILTKPLALQSLLEVVTPHLR